MRLKKPRIYPLPDDAIGDDIRSQLGSQFEGQHVLNVFRTLGKSLKAYRRFMGWGGYILSSDNDLSPRDRELVILRTGYNWQSGYEWAQHARIGSACGLSDEEIQRIKAGPQATGWSHRDRALLNATDNLTNDAFISDTNWAALSDFSEKQRMDLVMTVGQYTQVSMMLNSFGVQLDPGYTLDPDLDDR
ncbi:carboxymuconolactone decarboxylase family protein [Luminiphilus sp. nBUS_07]|uniref:carboxymuconolactone decarboxylase family protein n=1 Tax=Luminiphilus sp. nBUS_07 TaxID=3395314 RepID=UPI003EBEFD23